MHARACSAPHALVSERVLVATERPGSEPVALVADKARLRFGGEPRIYAS